MAVHEGIRLIFWAQLHRACSTCSPKAFRPNAFLFFPLAFFIDVCTEKPWGSSNIYGGSR